MCKCKISVALIVVLEGKLEFERSDCSSNYFNNPKQNADINKIINFTFC